MHRKLFVRNNFYTDPELSWVEFRISADGFNKSDSQESIASEANVQIPLRTANLDETDPDNVIREFSEVYVETHFDDGVTECTFHGFIDTIGETPELIEIHLLCPLGMLGKKRYELGTVQATVIKLGTAADPVVLKKLVESGEDRWVPDWTDSKWYDAYVPPTPPPNPPTDYPRRQWQAVGRLKDLNAQDSDPEADYYYPDLIIPIGMYRVGTDLLNYIEFLGYDPTHGGTVTPSITIDFLTVYQEGTNELENVVLIPLEAILPAGMGWEDGYHFKTTGTYYQKTIWPSLITINRFEWHLEDGTLLDMIQELFEQFAPPNYKIWWHHATKMLRMQYVEQTPHNTTTSYYIEGSYAFGGISPDTPPFNNSYIDVGPIGEGTYPRDEITFASKVIVSGTNEWPENAIKDDTLTDGGVTTSQATFESNDKGVLLLNQTNAAFYGLDTAGVAIPADWTQYGQPPHLIDMDMGTFFGMWWDFSTMPEGDEHYEYHPIYVANLGAIKRIDGIRFWGVNSRREFTFSCRFEVCNDFDPTGVTPLMDASWVALHKDLYDRDFKPYEEVYVHDNNFFETEYRYMLIWIKCGKIAQRGRMAAAFTDLQLIESKTVTGIAEIVHTADPVGTWNQTVGVGYNDGLITLNMPDLYDQLLNRPISDPHKLVAGHRELYQENGSIVNTNMCAVEAARILRETIRDNQQFGLTVKKLKNLGLYYTARVFSQRTRTFRKCLVENYEEKAQFQATMDCTSFSSGAWTGEVPEDL